MCRRVGGWVVVVKQKMNRTTTTTITMPKKKKKRDRVARKEGRAEMESGGGGFVRREHATMQEEERDTDRARVGRVSNSLRRTVPCTVRLALTEWVEMTRFQQSGENTKKCTVQYIHDI